MVFGPTSDVHVTRRVTARSSGFSLRHGVISDQVGMSGTLTLTRWQAENPRTRLRRMEPGQRRAGPSRTVGSSGNKPVPFRMQCASLGMTGEGSVNVVQKVTRLDRSSRPVGPICIQVDNSHRPGSDPNPAFSPLPQPACSLTPALHSTILSYSQVRSVPSWLR